MRKPKPTLFADRRLHRIVSPIIITGTLLLAACTAGPQFGLGIGLGPGGVTVSPNVSGNLGSVNVGVSGNGASAGTAMGGVGVGVGGNF